jgi:2-oxoisovalerate dehydrogenase E1 component
MCERCEEAAEQTGVSADILDLRTIMPWDKEAVLDSVRKTGRCLIVHEDAKTAGFGSEISAVIMREAFESLDAPVARLTMPDIPVPYNVGLMNAVVPGVDMISREIDMVMGY